MDENYKDLYVPFPVYESSMARKDRTIKWVSVGWAVSTVILCAVCVILAFLWHLCNSEWLEAWQSYDYESNSYNATQDGKGVNIIGGGNVNYGSESDSQNAPED